MLKNSVWIIITLFTLFNAQLAFSQLTDNPQINFELPADVESPLFTQATDIIVEASSGLGAKVFYQIPLVSDNVGIISGPTCTPETGAIFALGVSTVTCIASDAEGNVGRTIFSVTIKDTTPPSITALQDIIIENIDVQNIPLGVPLVSDIVDPFPVISNDFTALLESENIVTWTVTDFSGNSASATQIVKLVGTNLSAEVLPSNVFVFEATSPDGAKIDPSVLGILDPLQKSCQPAIDSIFPLGQNQLLCTELNNVNSSLAFTIVVEDTTPPTLFASFAPIKVEEDEGIFVVELSSTDLVDPNPMVTANINEFPVINGQLVKLELDSETELKHKTDLIKFEGTSFVLSATSSDFSGNTVTVTSVPQFEAEEEELVEEQIEAIEEELEAAEEELEEKIEVLKEEAELRKEQLEEEIEALEDGLEDADAEKQNEIKSQIESIKISIDELEKQTESIVENKKNEIEELKKQRETTIENKKREIEELKKQREKEELLANIQTQLDAVKSNELTALIASAAATIETEHSDEKMFAKLLERKTIEKSLQSQFESADADSRKKLDQLGLLGSTSSDEMKDLAKQEEKLREAALKDLEALIKNAEKFGNISLKEIEDLVKEELRKKEQELKEIEKLASNASDELEKKRIEKEIEQKKKEVEDFTKQKEAEFEKHKKEQEQYKKELEKALEKQKEGAEKEKKAIEKAIEKQKEVEEKSKQAQKEIEEKKKEIEEKAKEAEKKAEEQQKSESGDSSSGSNNDDDDDDDGDDDDDD